MISRDFRFDGFDARAWSNLLSLFRAAPRRHAHRDEAAPSPRGTLVVVRDEHEAPEAAFVTGRGPVPIEPWSSPAELAERCREAGAHRALVLEDGAVEELTERAAARIPMPGDYASQWLALLGVVRELEQEGQILFWPRPARVPLPTTAMLTRALDLLLPNDRAALMMLWEGDEIWTALAVHRADGEIDEIVGPERILEWTGPLGGDYRRDHRAVQRAVQRALGPLHVGLFAQRADLEELLRTPDAGAWARAVALRDVILSPAPPYAHVAVGADAARAAGRRARRWLGGLDLFAAMTPVAEFAREHIARVGSVTETLGFNPLEALAARLRTNPERSDDEA